MIDAILGQFVTELQRIRKEQGEDAYREAVKVAAKMAIGRGGQAEEFIRNALKGEVDFDEIRREMAQEAEKYREPQAPEVAQEPPPPPPPADETMAKTIMSQVPGCRTQAQFNAMMAAFDALRLHVSAIFTGIDTKESKLALDQALLAVTQATDISNKLRDVPEAATSPAAEEYKSPPKQFHEHDVQRTLLSELTGITTRAALNEWYTSNRARIDTVVSPGLRNALFDLIRTKRDSLTEDPPS